MSTRRRAATYCIPRVVRVSQPHSTSLAEAPSFDSCLRFPHADLGWGGSRRFNSFFANSEYFSQGIRIFNPGRMNRSQDLKRQTRIARRESATRTLLPRFVACPYAACLPMHTVHSIATTRCFLELNGAHHEPHFPDPLPHRIGRDGSGCEPVVRDHGGCRAGDVRLGHTGRVNHAADRAGACDDHCFEVGLTLRFASLLLRWCARRKAASNQPRHRARTCP